MKRPLQYQTRMRVDGGPHQSRGRGRLGRLRGAVAAVIHLQGLVSGRKWQHCKDVEVFSDSAAASSDAGNGAARMG